MLMKRNPVHILILVLFLLLQFSCQSPTDPEEADVDKRVILTGQVINAETEAPVDSAVIQLLNYTPQIVEITDSLGQFAIEFTSETTSNVRVVAFKESYHGDTTDVLIVPGRTIEIPAFQLKPTADTPSTSCQAASIVLVSQSAPSIGVKESGAVETAMLIYEVQDSMGVPIDSKNAVNVRFVVGSSPGGGEYFYPDSATTSANGRVRVYISSGIRSGVVQLQAEADQDGKTILSKPIAIAIHGGLPDSVHFSLAHDIANIPGWIIFGYEDIITAYVGDKYSNPVKPGTAVYFKTSGGIIVGSALTDNEGMASVKLYSAEPRPVHETYGAGFATITGYTADENYNTIEAYTTVLFSGYPVIDIQPPTFNIENGGSEHFNFTVSDQNGNPLCEGSSISVTIDGKNAEAKGNVSTTLPDTQSKGWTRFSFVLSDAAPDTIDPVIVSINIRAEWINGATEIGISGNLE
jgi:hypothetical protein